ncbi:MAG: hypothetical protein M0P69_14170 [Bacteroidales bacterium]|nr:hypothetical protein [Bacteroidales bacterium]
MTVRELLARIDSRELSEWISYYEMEPWGTDVEDWRAGMVASTIANVNRDPKKQRKPYTPKDFMPQRIVEQKEEQSWEEQARLLEMWFRTAGKKVN